MAGIAEQYAALRQRLRAEIAKALVGQDAVVDGVLSCLFCGGHCLLEGAPGLGKTLLVRTLASALRLSFARLQFTPDLMPADITGANILQETGSGGYELVFRPGPIFAQIVLADEINRATPKTQSALLEAMQEATVTAAGQTRALPAPFFVLATQNPVEMEGTYPLPEAQLDRFLQKVLVPAPERADLCAILSRAAGATGAADTASDARTSEEAAPIAASGAAHAGGRIAEGAGITPVMGAPEILYWREVVRQVLTPPEVVDYAARLVLATASDGSHACPAAKQYVRYGSSPRGGVALLLAAKEHALASGRVHACFADVRASAGACLRHRILLNFAGDAEGAGAEQVLQDALHHTPEQI